MCSSPHLKIVLDPFSLLDEENEQPGELQASIQEAPRRTIGAFVLAVLFAQAGLLAISLGLLFVGFQGQWTVGGTLLSGGILALIVTVVIYRWHRARN